ncbi:MAG: quinol:cytochrome C oxidoreductase [Bacteroidota bacterium]|nr:quinol:cytochrome C oxidoreductase [Bacteroidota bacterium]
MQITTEKFEFKKGLRNITLGLSALGILFIVIGVFLGSTGNEAHGDPHGKDYSVVRFWANFLLSNFFFLAIAATAVMWMAINYVAKAGWSVGFKRIPEAMSAYLPVAAISLLILVVISFISHNHGLYSLYEWLHLDSNGMLTHHDGTQTYDGVLHGKRSFLNLPFFLIRLALYFGIWILFRNLFRNNSIREDAEGGLRNYNRSFRLAAGFVPAFALTFCFVCYDLLMSLEPHWYSTIYAVNIFAGALVTLLVIIVMTIILMRRYGMMTWLNENHVHDLGKFMFGFSIFWTYTWVAQFLLIWYAHLPEELPYYLKRMHGGWYYLFFANLALNFIVPFLLLMTRDAKRNFKWMMFMCIVMLIARYVDWYLLVMPGTVAEHSGFGFYEIGFMLFYGGVFIFVMATALSKASLAPQNHPFFQESVHHEL